MRPGSSAPAERSGRPGAVDGPRPHGARQGSSARADGSIPESAQAQAQPGGVPVPGPGYRPRPLRLPDRTKPRVVVTEHDLRVQVEKMVEAYRLGDRDRFLNERDALEQMRARAGVANVLLASAALIRQSDVALAAGDFDEAVDLSSAAVRLSPDLVAAHWSLAGVLWTKDWTQLRTIGSALANLLDAQFGSFRNQVAFLTSVSLVLGLALALTVVVFALVQFIKYVRYPAHDLAKRVPSIFGTGELIIVLTVVALVPVAIGWGLLAGALAALVIVTGYQLSSERWVSWFMMVVVALIPLALYSVAPLITFHGSLVDDMATTITEAFAGSAERRLFAASTGTRSRDATSALILARRKRLRGDLEGADLAYQRALEFRPNDPVALNNRGVIQFMLGRHEAAVALFERGKDANRAESVLNLAIIREEEGKFEEVGRLLDQGRQLDRRLADAYTRQAGASAQSTPMFEAEIDMSVLWNRMYAIEPDRRWEVAESLWMRMGGGRLWSISVAAAIALLASLVVGAWSKRFSTGCPKCGTPADRAAYGRLCGQCNSVFVTAAAVEPRLRAKKEREVRSYQRRRRWTERLTSMFAGVGQFFGGRPLLGSILFFPFAVAMVAWVYRAGVMVHDWFIFYGGSPGSLVGGIALFVAGILSLVSIRQSFDR